MTTTATATAGTRLSLPRHTGTLRLPNRAPPAPVAMETDAVSPPATASAAAPTAVPSGPSKPAQARREQEDQQEAAVLRRRQELDETLAALRDRWPALFTAPVPLAIGIERKIQQTLGEARFSKVRLRRALHCWTRRIGYLAAIAEGQHRQDLDGSDAGEPEEAHRVYARELVTERRVKRPPRRYAQALGHLLWRAEDNQAVRPGYRYAGLNSGDVLIPLFDCGSVIPPSRSDTAQAGARSGGQGGPKARAQQRALSLTAASTPAPSNRSTEVKSIA